MLKLFAFERQCQIAKRFRLFGRTVSRTTVFFALVSAIRPGKIDRLIAAALSAVITEMVGVADTMQPSAKTALEV